MFGLAQQLGTTVNTIESMSRKEFLEWAYLDRETQDQGRAREEAERKANEWLVSWATSSSQSVPIPEASPEE